MASPKQQLMLAEVMCLLGERLGRPGHSLALVVSLPSSINREQAPVEAKAERDFFTVAFLLQLGLCPFAPEYI